MARSWAWALVPACTLLSGCGDDEQADAGGGETGHRVSIGPLEVESGEERTQCVIKRLDNPEPIRVGRIDNVISSSSHHLVVYRTNDTVEKPEPFDCDPFVGTLKPEEGAPVMITQKHEDFVQLPPGVAYSFDANQMIRLELHFINTGQEALEVTASSRFTPMSEEEFEQEADFLFIGSLDVSVKAKSEATVGPTYFAVPSEFDGSSFFAVTGHTHRFGTDVKIWTAPSPAGPDTAVYDVEGWLWNEPETVEHDPPFRVQSGGGFRFQCSYHNTSDQNVWIGESAKDEMCFFWAYYYPSKGARVCFHSDQFGFGDVCCPGPQQGICDAILASF